MDTSSTEDLLVCDSDDSDQVIVAVCMAAAGVDDFFASEDWLDDGNEYVNQEEGVRDVLATIRRTPSLFKCLTNFTAPEFEELCSLVSPVIAINARSTGMPRSVFGRLPKLSPDQRLLHFIMYMKHDNAVRYDAFTWNWSKSSSCDDSGFVASCINEALRGELRWPGAEDRARLASRLPAFPGCVGFIDGTLVEIRRPKDIGIHRRYFNGRKKIYCLNSTVVVDHDGLFIFVDPGYPGSYHDVNILRQSSLYRNWRQHFEHRDDYFEYLLGDPGYVGEEMFIMRRIDGREMDEDDQDQMTAVHAYNAMHGGHRVRVEWGIGGLKRKWKRLMKRFDSSREKFPTLFHAAATLTNFLQRRRIDMSVVVYDQDEADIGWEGDY